MKHTKPSHDHTHAPKMTAYGSVRYLDGSVLKRPFDPPRLVIAFCVVGGLVATGLGGYVGFKAIDHILHGEEYAAASVEENINRDVSYDFPALQGFVPLDDAAILASLEESGIQTFSLLKEGETGLDVMKLPSDVSSADAAADLLGGLDGMSAVTASRYFVGSWRLTTERNEGVVIRLRYADLKSDDAGDAVQAAFENEGWLGNDAVSVSGEGIDEVGNTFMEGTIVTDTGTYAWRISACSLDEVYDIKGLPETAQYVGIRIQG